MTSQVSHVSTTGIEYEYKWRIDDLARGVESGRPDCLDELLHEIISRSSGVAHVEKGPFTFAQSSLLFDTHDWQLAAGQLSFNALINYGSIPDVSWLVLKETVRWCGNRREALEVGERTTPRAIAGAMSAASCAPMQRLRLRLGQPKLMLSPFATAVQHRRKVILELHSGVTLAVSLDSTLATPLTTADGGAAKQHWWLEMEVNSGNSNTLETLEALASAVTDHLHVPPAQCTKPQTIAQDAGWRGHE